jgi:hypothetical protein
LEFPVFEKQGFVRGKIKLKNFKPKIWITNKIEEMKIDPEDFDIYKNKGFVHGRKGPLFSR